MAQSHVTTVQLFGPAGSVTTAAKTIVSQVNVQGPRDASTRVSQVTLVAPASEPHTLVSRVQLVGPGSALRSVYYGGNAGWVPVEVYLPINGTWTKIT